MYEEVQGNQLSSFFNHLFKGTCESGNNGRGGKWMRWSHLILTVSSLGGNDGGGRVVACD